MREVNIETIKTIRANLFSFKSCYRPYDMYDSIVKQVEEYKEECDRDDLYMFEGDATGDILCEDVLDAIIKERKFITCYLEVDDTDDDGGTCECEISVAIPFNFFLTDNFNWKETYIYVSEEIVRGANYCGDLEAEIKLRKGKEVIDNI